MSNYTLELFNEFLASRKVRDHCVVDGRLRAGIFLNLTIAEAEKFIGNGYKVYFGENDQVITQIRPIIINGTPQDRDEIHIPGRLYVQLDNNRISTCEFM